MLTWLLGPALAAQAGSGKIIKVLPHYLDAEGRHTLSPSLYERDAYQAHLRKHPAEISALRFDVQWKGRPDDAANVKLRVEIRGGKAGAAKPLVLEQTVKPGKWFSTWTGITVNNTAYLELGDLIAWRATLWDGERQLAEQKSFLW